jgi:hypothetical protein
MKIETDVPLPTLRQSHPELSKAAKLLASANIGDSVLISGSNIASRKLPRYFQYVGGNGWYTMRKTDEGYRVWKLKEPSKGTK